MSRFTITGLQKLQKELEDATRTLRTLEGELSAVTYNPSDPSSAEAAVAHMERAIDAKMTRYHGNTIVDDLVRKMKDRYRQAIHERAAEARSQKQIS